jgi:hypothetical protein
MSAKPFPDPSHVCAGSGEPILDAWTHGAIRMYPGATPDEIAEKVLGIARWSDAYDRRMATTRVREIMGAVEPERDRDWEDIRSAWSRWMGREGNRDLRPPKDELMAEAAIGRDRFDAALRRHDVNDYRYLRAALARGDVSP